MSDFDETMLDGFLSGILDDMLNTPQEQEKLEALTRIVHRHNIYDVLVSLSALNLVPNNQNKSDLLDSAIMALLSKPYITYCGKRSPDSKFLRQVIHQVHRLKARYRVDPTENVFVDRIMFGENYLVLPGINPEPTYTLQMLIYTLLGLWDAFGRSFHDAASKIIRTALILSDTIIRSQELPFCEVCHDESTTIAIPRTNDLHSISKNLVFNKSFIESLLQESLSLNECLTSFESFDIKSILDNSSETLLIQRPFISINDEQVAILNPSLLIPFAIHHVISLAERHGVKEKLFAAYNQRAWKECRHLLAQMGHKKLADHQFDILPINDMYLKEALFASSNDGIMLCQFVCDSGESYQASELYSQHTYEYTGETLDQRRKYYSDKLNRAGMSHYIHVVICNPLVRSLSFSLHPRFGEYGIVLTPHQLYCISVNERKKKWFLPRYILNKNKWNVYHDQNSNELDAISIYSANNESFYADDTIDKSTAQLLFPPGLALEYIVKARKIEDRHLIDIGDDRYHEVTLCDAVRSIYVAEQHNNPRTEFCVKGFGSLIWIRPNNAASIEELNIYNSLVDGISYWIAECREALQAMQFSVPYIILNIAIAGKPIDFYYDKPKVGELYEHVSFYTNGNTITMTWTPEAWRCFHSSSNHTEFDMMMIIFEELKAFCRRPVKRSLIESIFSNPLKSKFCTLSIEEHPYYKPVFTPPMQIYGSDIDSLLDEIGEYFLSMPEWNYGPVEKKDRNSLCNAVVSYLYSLLQQEVSKLAPTNLFSCVCYDLEVTMYNMMLDRKRYANDLACYPEKDSEHRNRHNSINKVSLSLKFLAEYISAQPPHGDQKLGELCYARILAICSQIIEWAYTNDLIFYNIADFSITFLPSGRIGISREYEERLYSANTAAQVTQLMQLSDPSIDCFSASKSVSEIIPLLDDAYEDEYGYSHTSFAKCIYAMIDFGDTLAGEVKKAPADTVIHKLAEATALPEETLHKILDDISLKPRTDYLHPDEPYKPEDVYPWRFNRRLSYSRRPIMRASNELIWGNRHLYHMMLFTIDLIRNGKLKAHSKKMKALIGSFSDKRGEEFNAIVAQKLLSVDGIVLKQQVKKINGLRIADANGNTYGDIDVLFAIPSTKTIVVGEVKDFSLVKNPYEMHLEYEAIFVDHGKKFCYLSKHKRRVDWIRAHLDDTVAFMGLPSDDWSIKDVMIVSSPIVSIDFYKQTQRVLIYSDICLETLIAI